MRELPEQFRRNFSKSSSQIWIIRKSLEVYPFQTHYNARCEYSVSRREWWVASASLWSEFPNWYKRCTVTGQCVLVRNCTHEWEKMRLTNSQKQQCIRTPWPDLEHDTRVSICGIRIQNTAHRSHGRDEIDVAVLKCHLGRPSKR